MTVVVVGMIGTGERWTDQLAIREAFLIRGLFGWHGVESIFHRTTCKSYPARRARRIYHNT
jgi:hypothetical protein